MKINIILITLFLFSSSIQAQEAPNKTDASGKKQGVWIKLDENKKKLYEGTFVNDMPVGKFIYYYDNETPYSIVVWSNNGKIGRTKLFDGGGKMVAEGKYVDQKKDSTWVFYNQEGKVLSEETYLMGKKNGVFKVYYSNGQIAEEKSWKNGLANGPWKKYFEDGQVKYAGQCVNDKVEGVVTFYHITGKVNATGTYKNDLKDGEWKYFKEDGKLQRTDKYIDGKMMATDKDYIPKEQVEEEKKKFEQFEMKDPFQDR